METNFGVRIDDGFIATELAHSNLLSSEQPDKLDASRRAANFSSVGDLHEIPIRS